MLQKECLFCHKIIFKLPSHSMAAWNNRVKCCSRSCASKMRGTEHLRKFDFKKGIQNNPSGGFPKGHKPANFKETGYGYTAIHKWLSAHFTKTGFCDNCGKNTNIDPKKKFRKRPRTQWANISGQYLRDRNDYQELCLKCHTQMHNDIHHPHLDMPR